MKQIIFIAILVFAFCTAALAQAGECPEITLVLPNQILVLGKSAIFSVEIGGKTAKTGLGYEWTVSADGFVKGQGTPEVEFVLREADRNVANVEVKVKIIGLPKDCPDTASDIMPAIHPPDPHPLDTFGKLASDDRKARLYNILIQVASDPGAEAVLIMRMNKADSRAYKVSLFKNILKFLESRKADLSSITFAVSEENLDEQTIVWLFPAGFDWTKIVDENYTIVKVKELEQKIDELFPKK